MRCSLEMDAYHFNLIVNRDRTADGLTLVHDTTVEMKILNDSDVSGLRQRNVAGDY